MKPRQHLYWAREGYSVDDSIFIPWPQPRCLRIQHTFERCTMFYCIIFVWYYLINNFINFIFIRNEPECHYVNLNKRTHCSIIEINKIVASFFNCLLEHTLRGESLPYYYNIRIFGPVYMIYWEDLSRLFACSRYLQFWP